MRIIGYWCIRCEDSDRKSFFLKKEGYCDCLKEMGFYEEELGSIGGGIVYGYKKATLKKCHANWKPVYLTEGN